jgi:AmmeMemoRadiSam system protein A
MRRSTFVTLRIDRALRGCCGSLHAPRPLAEDLWHNAWASAFSDPRFPPLTVAEYPDIDVHICVLSELEPLVVADEAQLLRWLRPAVDGLVLQLDATQVTFLPAVWRQLAKPTDFLRELKRKAGWRGDFWSPQLRVFRYTTVDVAERD